MARARRAGGTVVESPVKKKLIEVALPLEAINKPDDFILALVEFQDGETHRLHYLRRPFQREPDFGVTSVNYDFGELIQRAETPR
jgi:hypothetical protein